MVTVSDAYIVVEGTIIVTDPNNDAYDKKLFKNNRKFVELFLELLHT